MGGRTPQPTRWMLRGSLCLAAALLALCVGSPRAWALWGYEYTSSYDTSWYRSGASTFHIKTAKQLAGLAYLCADSKYKGFKDCTIVLDRNIDLSSVCGKSLKRSWRPIGCTGGDGSTNCPPFRGDFDGKGHTVSGLYINKEMDTQALFGQVAGSRIENLTVKGEVTCASNAAGIIANCSNTNLSNLTSNVKVRAKGSGSGNWNGNAGGVVGYAMTVYGSSTNTYRRLVNNGSVMGTGHYTGGVFGFVGSDDATAIEMSQCANTGDVTAEVSNEAKKNSDEPGKAVGGLVGSTTGGYGSLNVKECYNTGAVMGSNLASGGGLFGYLGGRNSTLSSSYNTGSVSGTTNAGGVVGYLGSTGGKVTSTYNSGRVSGSNAAGIIANASNKDQSASLNYTLKADGMPKDAYGPRVKAQSSKAEQDRDAFTSGSFLKQINGGDAKGSFAFDEGSNPLNGGLPALRWQGVRSGAGAKAGDGKTADEGAGRGAGAAGRAVSGTGSAAKGASAAISTAKGNSKAKPGHEGAAGKNKASAQQSSASKKTKDAGTAKQKPEKQVPDKAQPQAPAQLVQVVQKAAEQPAPAQGPAPFLIFIVLVCFGAGLVYENRSFSRIGGPRARRA